VISDIVKEVQVSYSTHPSFVPSEDTQIPPSMTNTPSSDAKAVTALILDFPASRMIGNKVLWLQVSQSEMFCYGSTMTKKDSKKLHRVLMYVLLTYHISVESKGHMEHCWFSHTSPKNTLRGALSIRNPRM
jgi:hypothetical protein